MRRLPDGENFVAREAKNKKCYSMSEDKHEVPVILVIETVRELRDSMKDLLTTDGYCVSTAKDEQEAVEKAKHHRPNLILVCPDRLPTDLASDGARIRELAGLDNEVPVVIFCIEAVTPGEDIAFENRVYVISPDNFNQLRDFLKRLLSNPLVIA